MKQQQNMAAIYCRLSRDDGGDAESNSIQTQRMMLKKYAKEHGFDHIEYIDDGWSGTTFERPSFKRMMAALSLPERQRPISLKLQEEKAHATAIASNKSQLPIMMAGWSLSDQLIR